MMRLKPGERIIGVYRSWQVSHNPNAPIAGQYRAERAGVGMNAGTYDALINMIDAKREQERAERLQRLDS
jgi:hypothetical protein